MLNRLVKIRIMDTKNIIDTKKTLLGNPWSVFVDYVLCFSF